MKISTICFPIKGDGGRRRVILATKKHKVGIGLLNGYGGKLDPTDQSIEDSAAREITEESTVLVDKRDLEKVAIVSFYEESKHLFECHVYFLHQWQGEFRETEEMGAPEEFLLEEVPYDRMMAADKSWLPLVFCGKKIKAVSVYNKGVTEEKSFEYELL